jgi:hypothetical protein
MFSCPLVLENHTGLTPIEIKQTSNPQEGDVGKFKVLEKLKKNILPGVVACTIDKPLLLKGENVFLPVSLL